LTGAKEKLNGEPDYRTVLASLNRIQVEGPDLTRQDITKLRREFGVRFTKALKMLKDKAVKRYKFTPSGRTQWIVVGKNRDYIIYDQAGFCSCDDFFFVVMDGKALVCPHLIAQRLAKQLEWYDAIEENDELFDTLMTEWRATSNE